MKFKELNKKKLFLATIFLIVSLIFLYQSFFNAKIIPLNVIAYFFGFGYEKISFFDSIKSYFTYLLIGFDIIGFIAVFLIILGFFLKLDNIYNKIISTKTFSFISSKIFSKATHWAILLGIFFYIGETFITKHPNYLFDQFLNYFIFSLIFYFGSKYLFEGLFCIDLSFTNLKKTSIYFFCIIMIICILIGNLIPTIIDPNNINPIQNELKITSPIESALVWGNANPLSLKYLGYDGKNLFFLIKNNSTETFIVWEVHLGKNSSNLLSNANFKEPTNTKDIFNLKTLETEFIKITKKTDKMTVLDPNEFTYREVNIGPCPEDNRFKVNKNDAFISYFDLNAQKKFEKQETDFVVDCSDIKEFYFN